MPSLIKPALLCLLAFAPLTRAQTLPQWPERLAFSTEQSISMAGYDYRGMLYRYADAQILDKRPEDVQRARRLMGPLVEAAQRMRPSSEKFQWEAHVSEGLGESGGAESLSNGGLMFSSEFISRYQLTDGEFSFLIAHEMAHVIAEHSREEASVALPYLPQAKAGDIDDVEHLARRTRDPALLALLTDLRARQELDADLIAIHLCKDAGVDTSGARSLLLKMSSAKEPSPTLTQLYQGRSRLSQVKAR